MRNTVPPRGGMIPMSMAARSAAPDRSAGVWSVTHNSRDTVCACGRTFLCGLAPSNNTTALSFLSIAGDHAANVCTQSHVCVSPRWSADVKMRRTMMQSASRPPAGCGMVGTHSIPVARRWSDEGEIGRLVGAIAPGMIGARWTRTSPSSSTSPSSTSAWTAGEHDGVIHRVRLESGMARRSRGPGGAVTGAVVGARALPLERGQARCLSEDIDDAENRADPWVAKPKGMVGDLVTAAVTGGRGPRLPHLGDDGAAGPAGVTCGAAASSTNTDRPVVSWLVTTRRIAWAWMSPNNRARSVFRRNGTGSSHKPVNSIS